MFFNIVTKNVADKKLELCSIENKFVINVANLNIILVSSP